MPRPTISATTPPATMKPDENPVTAANVSPIFLLRFCLVSKLFFCYFFTILTFLCSFFRLATHLFFLSSVSLSPFIFQRFLFLLFVHLFALSFFSYPHASIFTFSLYFLSFQHCHSFRFPDSIIVVSISSSYVRISTSSGVGSVPPFFFAK